MGDLPLGPEQPLAHGRLGGQEGPGDRVGGQAGDHLERQRDPGLHRQGGVAAGEDQPQPVVGRRAPVSRCGPAGRARRQATSASLARSVAARRIRSIARRRGRRGQPGGRVVGYAVVGPALAGRARRRRRRRPRPGPSPRSCGSARRRCAAAPPPARRRAREDVGVARPSSFTRRRSAARTAGAPAGRPAPSGAAAAISIASSRSAHSRMSKPAIHSRDSANGPSVTSTLPPRRRTVVASSGGRSRSPITRVPGRRTSPPLLDLGSPSGSSGSGSGSVATNIRYFMSALLGRCSIVVTGTTNGTRPRSDISWGLGWGGRDAARLVRNRTKTARKRAVCDQSTHPVSGPLAPPQHLHELTHRLRSGFGHFCR